MKKELLRAGIGVALFLLLLGGVVLFSLWGQRARTPEATPTTTQEEGQFGGIGETWAGEPILPPRPAPDFKLIDHSGKEIGMQDFRGKVVLLSFAYTSCPAACPILFSIFQGVQQELKDYLGKGLELVFITVDPEVDTPERLERFISNMGARWYFLTGPLPTMQKVWKKYDVYVEKKGEGDIVHSNLVYLIDQNGLMQARYRGFPSSEVLIRDVKKILKYKAEPHIRVEGAWVRPVMENAAGFMVIFNEGEAEDALIGVSSSIAGSVGLHRTVMEGEIMKMEPVPRLVVPAGGKVELKPLGLHLMLRELRGELMAGQKIELILQFEKSGEVKVEAEVKEFIEKPMEEHEGH